MEFKAWPKTPRLFGKPMTVTEKIDGTNACVVVTDQGAVGAQSRNRMLPMGPRSMDDLTWQKSDNAGFAAWVREHQDALANFLGEGYHYGEWFGYKIARNYGLSDKRFALFNSARWGFLADPNAAPNIPGLVVVPTLHTGPFDTEVIKDLFGELMEVGSQAVPGFAKPEGLIVHHMGNIYKMTDQGDKPKYAAGGVIPTDARVTFDELFFS